MAVDMELMRSIVELDQEIDQQKAKIKDRKRDYKDELLQTDEYKAHEDAKASVKVEKARLDRAILISPTLNRLKADIEGETTKLKDLREIMSHHLIKYFEESGRRVITVNEAQEIVKEILISAKLGKETLDPETLSMDLGK